MTATDPVCGTVEACNGLDDDCDGVSDEDCVDASVQAGCADGQREGFLEVVRYPDIAACAGGFAIEGLAFGPDARCNRVAGDDGTRPAGSTCSAEDLCAPGWSVCPDEAEVARLAGGCADAATEPGTFFATRQSGPGYGIEVFASTLASPRVRAISAPQALRSSQRSGSAAVKAPGHPRSRPAKRGTHR